MEQTLLPQASAPTLPQRRPVLEDAGTPLPVPRNPRYRSLDIWRGVACLMVVVFHASLYGSYWGPDAEDRTSPTLNLVKSLVWHMQFGVAMFFVISGYCIAASADATRRRPQPLRQFFLRRLRRIYPPYWIALLITLGMTLVVVAVGWPPLYFEDQGGIVHCANPFTLTASQWLGNLTLTEVWRHHLFGEPIRYILGQSWSLCYEEQFYALCGLLLFLGARRFFVGTVVLTVGVLAVAPLSFVWPGSTKGFFFDGFWLLFALGVLIYYRLNYPPKRFDGLCWLLFGIGPATFMAFCAGVLPENPTLITISYELTIGSVLGLVLLFLHGRDAALMQSKLLRPFAFCGTMCYSLYLIHWPLAEIVGLACYHLGIRHMWDTLLITVPLVMVLSIGAAWVFYQIVERHFLNATAR